MFFKAKYFVFVCFITLGCKSAGGSIKLTNEYKFIIDYEQENNH